MFFQMSNEELVKIIEDYCNCENCAKCKADGILCGFSSPEKFKMDFLSEVAKRLKGENNGNF